MDDDLAIHHHLRRWLLVSTPPPPSTADDDGGADDDEWMMDSFVVDWMNDSNCHWWMICKCVSRLRAIARRSCVSFIHLLHLKFMFSAALREVSSAKRSLIGVDTHANLHGSYCIKWKCVFGFYLIDVKCLLRVRPQGERSCEYFC